MIYFFVFLGEFGVELLNWQGVVRTLRQRLPADDKIVCCSRASVYPLYEFCDAYIDIGAVPAFQASRSLAYFAVPPSAASGWDTLAARRFDRVLKTELRKHILVQMREEGLNSDPANCRFIFSSDHTALHGLTFGRRRRGLLGVTLASLLEEARRINPRTSDWLEARKDAFFTRAGRLSPVQALDRRQDASIYALPNLADNTYVRIAPDLTLTAAVQEKLGWNLNEPFLLCQTRQRPIVRRSVEQLPWPTIRPLLQSLAEEMRIVLLSFQTGRKLDSYSSFSDLPNFHTFPCRSFPEQAILIHFASHCLFFTEGDFGSHIYVPPLMGRDVTVLAAASMYTLPTAPVAFWNENVFRFGGQILPRAVEDAFASPQTSDALRCNILAAARLSSPEPLPALRPRTAAGHPA